MLSDYLHSGGTIWVRRWNYWYYVYGTGLGTVVDLATTRWGTGVGCGIQGNNSEKVDQTHAATGHAAVSLLSATTLRCRFSYVLWWVDIIQQYVEVRRAIQFGLRASSDHLPPPPQLKPELKDVIGDDCLSMLEPSLSPRQHESILQFVESRSSRPLLQTVPTSSRSVGFDCRARDHGALSRQDVNCTSK